jgi:steroid 5-alpha reductase family enzyme
MYFVIYISFAILPAAKYRFDKVTDLAGGTNFVILAILTWSLGGDSQIRTIVLNVLVIAWGLRLSGYLFVRMQLFVYLINSLYCIETHSVHLIFCFSI